MKRSLLAVALVVGLIPGVAAEAATPEALRAEVARIRELIATGRLEDVVRAGAALGEVPLTAPIAASPLPVAGLPPGLAGPVEGLLSATRAAGDAALTSLRVTPRELMDLRRRSLGVLAAAERTPGQRAPKGVERRVGDLSAAAAAAVDQGRLYGGALQLARAIDRTLPALRAYAAAIPRSVRAAAGCDVLDQGPVCVGGQGSNTYTGDRALVIDLGGDDTHAHSAGGAWLNNPGSVTIDLGGNDRYDTPVPTPAGSFAVQGAGVIGVGILIDVDGNDTYTATVPDRTTSAYAQGVGGGAGVGILSDLAGNDTYLVTNHRASGTVTPGAQAMGDTGGFGAVIDRDGNDIYDVETSSCGGCHQDVHAFAYAETGGVALHADGGGTDRLSLRVIAGDAPVDAEPPAGGGETNAWGFGFGLAGGEAVMLSGTGPTERTLLGQTGAPPGAGVEVRGFGHANLASLGVVSDAGGDDIYRADAISRDIRHLSVDDACECEGVRALAEADQASVIGMGYAQLGGAGLLQDGGGNDRYLSNATSYAEAEARDDRTALSNPGQFGEDIGAQAEARVFYNNFSIVQGVATSGGVGVLDDAGGDDVYESRAGARAVAHASAYLSEATVKATAAAPGGISQAQAAGGLGYGLLTDRGGADRYVSESTSQATADPPTSVSAGNPSAQVQGDGQGWLADLGAGADVFVSIPPNPTCSGTRGQGVWLDCSNNGGGFNQ